MSGENRWLELAHALTTHTALIKIITVIAAFVAVASAIDQAGFRNSLPPDAMAPAVIAGAGLIALAIDGRR